MTMVAEGSHAPSATGAFSGTTVQRKMVIQPMAQAGSFTEWESPASCISVVGLPNVVPVANLRQAAPTTVSAGSTTLTSWASNTVGYPISDNLVYFYQFSSGVVTSQEQQLTWPHQAAIQNDRIINLLDQYTELKDGWLDERSIAPGQAAVERARKLYLSAKSNDYSPVRCYVSADGEVGLIWEKGNGYGNVGFWKDGSLVYYVRSPVGKEVRGDITINEEKLPMDLIKALRIFYVGT